jgi:hypothetical protein
VASGRWQIGDTSGRWTARLALDGEAISGSMQLRGGPVRTAEVVGSLRLGHLDLGLISGGEEIASFHGQMLAHGAEGVMESADGARGTWSGTWEIQPATYTPIVNGRSGTVEAPFDKPSAVVEPRSMTTAGDVSSPCGLPGASGASYLSLGGQLAVQAGCPSPPQALAACPSGLPASNPATPSQVSGALANNVTRSQQQWPWITQSEVSIVATPAMGVAAYNNLATFRGPLRSGVGFSRLAVGGWTENPDQQAVPPIDETTSVLADPALALTTTSQIHLGYLGLQLGLVAGFPFIGQVRSTDAGTTFLLPHTAIPASQDYSVDKPWLAIDRTSNPASNGTQYLCWTQIWQDLMQPYQYTQIWFAGRTAAEADGGAPYPNPVPVSGVRQFIADSNEDVVQGCQVAVAPDSSVYVIWWEQIQLGAYKISSINGKRTVDGVSFGPQFGASGAFVVPGEPIATQACRAAGWAGGALNGNIRTTAYPSLAVDQANGSVYVAHSRRPGESGSEVVLVRSADHGATWSQPLVVHDASPGDKFMPAVAVNEFNHVVKVMWYDRRNDPANLSIDVYTAASSDGGASFASISRLTAAPFGVPRLLPNFDCDAGGVSAGPCYMGDYNGLSGFSTTAGFVHGWGDNSLKFSDTQTGQDVPDPDVRVLAGC